MLELAVAAASGGILLIFLLGHPRLALVLWVLSLTMIPPWVSVNPFIRMPASFIVALLVITIAFFHSGLSGAVRFSKYDLYFGAFIVVCVGVLLTGNADPHAPVIVFVSWVVPYLTARVLTAAAGIGFTVDVIAIVFGVVAALAILELAMDWHPFESWNFGSTAVYELWRPIQMRLGLPRSEWAFGHSIALGGSLALSIPFIARSSYSNPMKAALFILVGSGVVAAASRGAAVAAVVTAGMCVLNARKLRNVRALSFVVAGTGIVLTLAFLLPVLDIWLIGTEYGDRSSALYRGEIYGTFLQRIEWLAPYGLYNPGEHADKSIDSAILDIGLRLGWLVLILATIPVLVAAARVLLGTATLGEIALVGQVPVFATAALITQYEFWIFLVAGLTVTILTAPPRAEGTGSAFGGGASLTHTVSGR